MMLVTADTNSVNLSERWWWYYLFCRFSLKCQSLLLCFSLWSRYICSHSGLCTPNIICDIAIGCNYSCDCQPRNPCCGMWQLMTRVNFSVDVTVLCSLRWISHCASCLFVVYAELQPSGFTWPQHLWCLRWFAILHCTVHHVHNTVRVYTLYSSPWDDALWLAEHYNPRTYYR